MERLRAVESRTGLVDGSWIPIDDDNTILHHLPPFSRVWTLRAAVQARQRLAALPTDPDVVFFHTVAPAVFARKYVRRWPTVISLDATPRNVDELASGYGHQTSLPPIERLKTTGYRKIFQHSDLLIAWSDWVRRSLVDDYRVDSERVVVLPPGVPVDRFRPGPAAHPASRVNLLFVGGDFGRKGGPELLQVFDSLPEFCHLHIVTRSRVDGSDRVTVYSDVRPDSQRLLQLFHLADIFVLPTRADTWGHAVVEAMSSGLPIVTTRVGALPEIVRPGIDGFMVSPGNDRALSDAIRSLVDDPDRRSWMGQSGRERVLTHFDGERNMTRLLRLVASASVGGSWT